jgi:hypothetical protein
MTRRPRTRDFFEADDRRGTWTIRATMTRTILAVGATLLLAGAAHSAEKTAVEQHDRYAFDKCLSSTTPFVKTFETFFAACLESYGIPRFAAAVSAAQLAPFLGRVRDPATDHIRAFDIFRADGTLAGPPPWLNLTPAEHKCLGEDDMDTCLTRLGWRWVRNHY